MSDTFCFVVCIYSILSIIFSLLFYLDYGSLDEFKCFFSLKEVFVYIWFAPGIALIGLLRFVFSLDIWETRIFNNQDRDK